MTAGTATTTPHPHLRIVTRAAWLAVWTNSGLLLSKAAVGWWTGSIVVISEALDSLVDLVAAVTALFAVRAARAPADRRHRYGHGKFEGLAGAFEGLLIVLTVLGVAWLAVQRILAGAPVVRVPLVGVAVLIVSIVIKMRVSRHLDRVSEQTESLALEADAWHLKGDAYVSVAAIVGLFGVWVGERMGIPALRYLDPMAALLVVGVMLTAGLRVTWGAVTELADVALPPAEERKIQALLDEHTGRFVDFHAFRSRRSGPARLMDLHLTVCRYLTVAESHNLTDHLEADLDALYPGVDVLIHVEPCAGGCPTCGYKDRWPPGAR